jgi:MFS family permease
MFQALFPKEIFKDKTLFLYFLYKFLYGIYPINVIIALFFLAKGFSYADIGIVFGVFSVAGFLFEIPTGYFGDKYGRRSSVIAGLVTMSVTSLVWTYLSSTVEFAIFAGVWMLGISFISGSLEAYIYDHLENEGRTQFYDTVLSKSGSLHYFAAAIGSIVGAYLFSININYPYYLLSLLFIFSAGIVYLMPKEESNSSIVDTELNVLSGLKHILKSQQLILITLFVSLLFGFYYYFIHSVDKPYVLSLEIFTVEWLGFFASVIYIIQALVISQFEKLKKNMGEFQIITLAWIIFSLGLLGMYKFFGLLGLISALVFYSSEPFRDVIINSFSQKHIPKKIRATALSSIKVYQSFFAAILGFLAGSVFDRYGVRNGIIIAFVYSVIVYIVVYLYKTLFKVRLD